MKIRAGRKVVHPDCLYCLKPFPIEEYRLKSGEGVYCSRDCYSRARSSASAAKFWENCERTEFGCLEWKGAPMAGGYGRVRINGQRTSKAHRHAWYLSHGSIPEGMFVCHKCDNPICVNPEHLFLGTAHDNMRDMAAKGRAAGSTRRGERHPLAKLTEAQVSEIARRYVPRGPGKSNAGELAREFGVRRETIRHVALGRRLRPA